MTKFRIEHEFQGISVPDYERLYFDEDFNIALCEEVDLERELLALDETDGRLSRDVKVAPRGRQIPKPIAKFMGGARIEYVEKLQYTFGTGKGTWQSISSLMTDKISSSGTFEFHEMPGGVRRVVQGEIKVKIFGVGGTIEQFIVDDVKRSYDDAAKFTRKWLQKSA